MGVIHKPVMLKEALDFLNPGPGKIIIDATVGGGGHAIEIMKRIGHDGRLIGIDRDSETLKITHERLQSEGSNFKLVNKNFKDIKEVLMELGIGGVDGVLLDFGISSIQMETPQRGFGIKNSGPLDMRMDRNQELTAKDFVHRLKEDELAGMIRDFGEERFFKRIAKAIVRARKTKVIETTSELAQIISESLPYSSRRQRIHPATRAFQAIRIKVNNELDAIRDGLLQMPDILKGSGRICVLSFHSLEDRIVKNTFKEFKQDKSFSILTKKPVRPSKAEVLENLRARSAKLRAAERVC